MRVLLVAHGFPPRSFGGTEQYVQDLARALVREHADEVLVVAREADPTRPEFAARHERRDDGLTLVSINNTFRSSRTFADSYRNAAIRRAVGEVIASFAPDVAHVHHLTCLSTDLLDELAARGVPVVFTLHDFWMACQRGQLLDLDLARCAGPTARGCARCLHCDRAAAQERMRHVREVCRQVSRFLAPSQTLRRFFLDFGLDEERITFFETGIDHRPFREGPVRSSSPVLRLGFAGSLMVSKAPHVLLEAAAGLPVTVTLMGPTVAYHGDDSYRHRLAPLLAGRHVRNLGQVSHDQMPAAMADLDVLVVPSIWLENAPFVIREAFVAGLPVLASDQGGMRELVRHEHSGLLFPPGDVAALRACLLRLLHEEGLLDRLRAGLPRMRTIEEDAAETRDLYTSLRAAPAR
jgi:glycosyltransferase involved in cell wall biosynthesis